MLKVFKWLLFSLILLCSLQMALGCMCDKIKPNEYFQKADVVFVGKVLEVNNYKDETLKRFIREIQGESTVGAKFQVAQVWKGEANYYYTINSDSTSCDFNFVEGEEYLIYAKNIGNGSFYAEKCDGTSLINRASNELNFLTTLKSQIPKPPSLQASIISWFYLALIGISLLILSLIYKKVFAKKLTAQS